MIKNDVSQNNERENEKDVIFGRNSVAEAIKSGRPLDSVMVARGDRSGSIPKIVADAKKAGIVIKEVDPKKLDFVCGHNNHQGIAAFGAVKEYSTIEDIFATAEERNEAPFIIICDEIEDPHNLGAIIRTAEAAGAHGVIIPKRRSASLSFTVAKTSAGAVEFIACVKSIENNYVHQTVGLKETDEECDLDYCMGSGVDMEVNYALSNSLGFGGHNASILVRKF